MKDSGDLHNFGRQVSLDESKRLYHKPRCVFWEQFYFGQSSPLFKFFQDNLPPADFNFFQKHFKLIITGNDLSREGYSSELISNQVDSSLSCSDVGQLIAYCSVFGIMDLHAGNLIFNGTSFIPIDVEVVNAVIRVPSETLLLPINEEERPFSLYNTILPFLGLNNIEEIADNIIKMIGYFLENLEQLKIFLGGLNLSNYPIRVILRHTLDYNSEGIIDLMSEEIMQLNRGDIPYFFKYINDDKLYYFDENLIPKRCKILSERAQRKLSLIGNGFDKLLSRERISESILPNILLQFFRHIQSDLKVDHVNTSLFKYCLKEDEIFIELGLKMYKTTRFKRSNL